MINRKKISGLLLAASVILASCGGYGGNDEAASVDADVDAATNPQAQVQATPATPAPANTPAASKVVTSSTALGDVLVADNGFTLYGFTNDVDGVPTCSGPCAGTWPALTVEGETLPAGLDPAVFSIVEGVDGSSQLKAGKWPLYFFAGDAAAGDVNGQNSGGVWFVVAADGSLVKGAQTATAEAPQSPATSAPADPQGGPQEEPATSGY